MPRMLASPAAPSLRAMPRRGPLIGRDLEQAELGGILAEAAAGRGGVALVAGEAGVGKTRLVEATIRTAGLRVLRGHATEEATPPFGPLAAALRSQLRDEHDQPSRTSSTATSRGRTAWISSTP
jgi:MoxR-like ATPase